MFTTVRIKLVRPLSTVDNTRDYARVSHSRQWSNYNIALRRNTDVSAESLSSDDRRALAEALSQPKFGYDSRMRNCRIYNFSTRF